MFLLKIACWSTEEIAGKQVAEVESLFNLFQVNASFLSPPENRKKLKNFDVLLGYKNKTLPWNGRRCSLTSKWKPIPENAIYISVWQAKIKQK